ncbi:MAG: hemerythrin domain-containing protein [Myxococcota bacterium]
MGLLARTSKDGDDALRDALLDCHERIRHFAALAVALGRRADLAAGDVADAARRIARYFGTSLPLHVRDEEDTLARALAGREPDLDRALATMASEHAQHAAPLAELLALTGALAAEPARHAAPAARLDAVASALEADFAHHLAAEEAVVFPALLRCLTPAERDGCSPSCARGAPSLA